MEEPGATLSPYDIIVVGGGGVGCLFVCWCLVDSSYFGGGRGDRPLDGHEAG